MTDDLRILLEAAIRQGIKDDIVFVGVTISTTPPEIIFWRNTKDTKEEVAAMFEFLAADIRKRPMQEVQIPKES